MFKEGYESVEDEPRAGHPLTSRTGDNKQRMRHLLNSDRRLSVRMVAKKLGMNKMIMPEIITEVLEMKKICAKFVPKILAD